MSSRLYIQAGSGYLAVGWFLEEFVLGTNKLEA